MKTSVIAMCQLVSVAHSKLPAEDIAGLLTVLKARCTNDMTSYAALRGLIVLATTDKEFQLDLKDLGQFAENFIELMKKAER